MPPLAAPLAALLATPLPLLFPSETSPLSSLLSLLSLLSSISTPPSILSLARARALSSSSLSSRPFFRETVPTPSDSPQTPSFDGSAADGRSSEPSQKPHNGLVVEW